MKKNFVILIAATILFSCKLMPKKEEKENIKPMTGKNFIWNDRRRQCISIYADQ